MFARRFFKFLVRLTIVEKAGKKTSIYVSPAFALRYLHIVPAVMGMVLDCFALP